jgi:spore coat protein CotH
MKKSDIEWVLTQHSSRLEKEEYQKLKVDYVNLASEEYAKAGIDEVDGKINELVEVQRSLQEQIRDLQTKSYAVNNDLSKLKSSRSVKLNSSFGISQDWYTKDSVVDVLSEKLAKSKNAKFETKMPVLRVQLKEALVLSRTTQGLALLLETVLESNGISDQGLKSYVQQLSVST